MKTNNDIFEARAYDHEEEEEILEEEEEPCNGNCRL
jgi:hypothetical protein